MDTKTLDEMVVDEGISGVSFSSQVGKALDSIQVPLNKDKNPDMKELIDSIRETAERVGTPYMISNKIDPQWLPGYEILQTFFETNKVAIENGKLTPEGKRALIELYAGQVDGKVVDRGTTRYQAEAPEVVDKSGTVLAEKTSNKYLVSLIKSARTAAEKAARVRTAMTDAIQKMRQWYQTEGNLGGFKPAYSFGGSYK